MKNNLERFKGIIEKSKGIIESLSLAKKITMLVILVLVAGESSSQSAKKDTTDTISEHEKFEIKVIPSQESGKAFTLSKNHTFR